MCGSGRSLICLQQVWEWKESDLLTTGVEGKESDLLTTGVEGKEFDLLAACVGVEGV